MKIVSNRYGKRRVRVLKVIRDGARHEVKELDCAVLLEGDFGSSYFDADNSKVVPTDTVKNTITILAHKLLGLETERFGLELGRHFIGKYAQVQRVHIELSERPWNRHAIGGTPHEHTFLAGSGAPFVKILATRGSAEEIESGVDDLLVMKSTGSGFKDYPRCDYTTLPETDDRILATKVRASWHYASVPADFNAANKTVLEAVLRIFAVNFSASVQATMSQMAEAAFLACQEINRVTLALPNKHYLLANLKPFGLENPNITFVPTDEPHGQIEATFNR
ncbi:factor-independent urate hydroxylase [Oleiharenicola lentus]|uniref:factor-independent urate hydroxylase n=1 Tax=Oleiharenicola lentus TaxID=2508720 RepID=UPI003F67DDC2